MIDRPTLLRLLACTATAFLLAACGKPTPEELIASAKTKIDKDGAQAAVVELKTALQAQPQNAQARFLLGKALLKQGQVGPALVELERALELKHPDHEAVPLLAKGLMAAGQARRVTDRFAQTSFESKAASSELKATLAAAYGAQGKLPESAAAVEAALQLDPKNTVARLLQARLAAGAGRNDDALAALDALIADAPKSAEAWHLKGEVLWIAKGDAKAGEEAFRKALEANAEYLPAHRSLIEQALLRKDIPAFKLQVQALKKAFPKSADTLFFETQLALIEGNIKAAREGVQRLMKSAPENTRVLQLAGAVELGAGSLVVAANHLSRAIQLDPRLPVARRLLAQTHLRSGEAARALAVLQPLLDSERPNAETLALAAEAHLQNDQVAQAEALFQRAAKLTQDNAGIRTALAVIKIARGDAGAGFSDLEALTQQDPGTYADFALVSARLRAGDLDGALKALERLQTKDPKSARAPHLQGQLLLRKKDVTGARSSFERSLALDPNYFPAVAALTDLDIADKKVDQAIKRLEDVLKREPKTYRALLGLALLKQRNGAKPEEISTLLADAIKANPGEVAPRLMLVDFLLARNDVPRAKAAAQEATSAIADNPVLLDALGRAQLASGDVQQAVSSFGKVVASQPKSVLALLRLAEAQSRNKDQPAAIQSLRRALEVNPAALPAQQGLVRIALNDKRFDDAMGIARTVQKQRPKEAAGFLLEAEVASRQRKWTDALASFRAALEREKSSETAMRVHAALTLSGKADEAERFANTWIKDQPKDAVFLMHLGAAAMDQKQYAAAEARYRAVLGLVPASPVALNNVAWLMVQQRKPGALEFAEKAQRAAPESAEIMDTLASALAAENRTKEALEWQRKAVAKVPAEAAAKYRLGLARILVQSGDKAGARTELEALAYLGDKFARQGEVAELLARTR